MFEFARSETGFLDCGTVGTRCRGWFGVSFRAQFGQGERDSGTCDFFLRVVFLDRGCAPLGLGAFSYLVLYGQGERNAGTRWDPRQSTLDGSQAVQFGQGGVTSGEVQAALGPDRARNGNRSQRWVFLARS